MKKSFDLFKQVSFSYRFCADNQNRVLMPIAITAIISLALPLLANYYNKGIIEAISCKMDIHMFLKNMFLWSGILLLLEIISLLSQYVLSRKNRRLRNSIVERINFLRMSVPYEKTLDLNYQKSLSVARLSMDKKVPCVVNVQLAVVGLITSVVCCCTYMVLISKLHWAIVVAVIISYIGMYVCGTINAKHTRVFRELLIPVQRKIAYVAGRSGNVQAAKDIRVYGMENWFSSKYEQFSDEKEQIIEKRQQVEHTGRIVNALLVFARSLVSYIVLIFLYMKQTISIDDFVFFIGLVTAFSTTLSKVQENIQLLHDSCLDVCDYMFFEEESTYTSQDATTNSQLPNEIETIKFEHVSFRYPESVDDVINDICFEVRKNEKLGLVGLNGAGKTTLILLMCGLLQPTEGKVLLNGRDVREFGADAYLSLFSAVFQDISLLPVSVRENIILGNECPGHLQITELIRECGLEHIDLDAKFIQEIHRNAICLSGGELQRFALVRAMHKPHEVLILDEPTAALDPLAEKNLYLNYGQYSEGKISVFISHRLASTAFCDNVIMLEKGTIIERGTHAQLMELGGKYKEMFEVQRSYYSEHLGGGLV